MKIATAIAMALGVGLVLVLVLSSGYAEVGQAFAQAGWGVVWVALARVVLIGAAGAPWWLLLSRVGRAPLHVCVALRWIRDAVNSLLPVAQVGGDLVGARLLTFFGPRPSQAVASVITDVLVQVGTQFVFTIAGLLLLIAFDGDPVVVRTVSFGLLVALPALVGFYFIQRREAHGLITSFLRRLAGDRQWLSLGAMDEVYGEFERIRAQRGPMIGAILIHMAVWIGGSIEVYIALAFMGHPIGFAEAVVIESLTQAVRGAAFAVPGALGVQEGGLILLAGIFGVPADVALALSLIKRVADLALGVPGLLGWQWLEGRRVLARNGGKGGGVDGVTETSAANDNRVDFRDIVSK